MVVREFIDVLESSISKSDHGGDWNVSKGYVVFLPFTFVLGQI